MKRFNFRTRGATVLLALLALSCGKPDAEVEAKRLTVFATLYPLAEIAREIGANDVRVDWLIESGKPLVINGLTPRERDRMNSTDFTLCDSYRRTETWAEADLARRKSSGRIISADSVPVVSSIAVPGLLYLDPIVARQYAAALSESFAIAMPDKADAFRTRSTGIIEGIDRVVAQFPNSAFLRSTVAVLSTTYGCVLDRFAISSVLIEHDAYRLSDDDLESVRRVAGNAGAVALLIPFDLPPGAVSRIRDKTGLKTYAIDALGYSGLKGHETYLDLLQYNLTQLQQATAK